MLRTIRHFALTAALVAAVLTITIPAPALAEGGTISGKVTAKNPRHLKDTVVYLAKVPGDWKPAKKAVMDQEDQKFDPHVLPVVRGTTVVFENSDNTGHNVFSPDGEGYDLGVWGKGETRSYTFEKTGVYTQLCRLHPSMVAFVLVLQNPFFAVAGADGRFKIEGVPPGTYTLKAWSERTRARPQKVEVMGGETLRAEVELR